MNLKDSVCRTFSTDHGVIVLRHLEVFARADEADYCADPRKDAYLQGRRSVIMEIRRIMKEKSDE